MMATVYALTDDDGEVRYVGKTTSAPRRRLVAHISEARRGGQNHRCRWIRKLLRNGTEPRILPLLTVDGDGCKDEIVVISAFRAGGMRLVNATDGGEGRTGARRTEAEKAFLAQFHRGRKITWGSKISAAKRGVTFTEEHRRHLSEAQRSSPAAIAARAARRGANNPCAKLTTEAAIAIREDTRRQSVIARHFGVSQALVSSIKSGRRWDHLRLGRH